ncbi:MAG TPA: zinc ribbon domain-containing protein [Promineifilum sp.]|nr:zinc ribbon domain-containing protein [Promineifilum sp.]HRQ13668.1 zinc ribbon domain-containing protein [Promineifilum sp.]
MSSFLSNLTLGSALLGLALVVIVLLYLARPFAMYEDEEVRVNREEIDGLLLHKADLLRSIRELDDDYDAAKVAPELYAATRPQLMKQAALVMKQLDDHGYVEAGQPVAADIDAQIEAAVRRARTPEQLDEQLEAVIRQARGKATASVATTATTATAAPSTNGTAQFCPQCGRRVEKGDRFCPKCGHNHVGEAKSARAARA